MSWQPLTSKASQSKNLSKVEYHFLTLIILFYFRPSPIQAQAWPYLLSGKDVIGIAQTGRKDCIQILEIKECYFIEI